jgi:predicted phage terminase large subunit-like protein
VALFVVGRDATGRDFVLDGQWREMSPSDTVARFFDYYVKWGCRAALMEKVAASECFAAMIDEQCIARQVRVQLVQVGGRSTESKESRIEALEIPMTGGVLYFSAALDRTLIHLEPDGKCYGEIVEQFVRFPHGAHDDVPDALSDLYKRDHMGSPLCPRPKPYNLARNVITTVNGRMVNVQARPAAAGGDFWGNLQRQVGAGGMFGGSR